MGFQDEQEQEEYVAGILLWLESFCQHQLQGEEIQIWSSRLKNYPKWKLSKMSEYTGRMNNDVFKYLDDMRGHKIDSTPQLPPAPEPKSQKLGHIVLAYVKRLNMLGTIEEKLKCELEFMTTMRKRYPHVTWDCGMKGNKGK
jgi:hypothetical protein